jgi:septal ring factor EnvC (AmiA/AmiB activator)
MVYEHSITFSKNIASTLNILPVMFQEIVVVNAEKQLAQVRLDTEHQKGISEQTGILLEELKKHVESKENELKIVESDLQHSMLEVRKKEGALDSLLRKLEELTSKSGVGVGQRKRVSTFISYSAFQTVHQAFKHSTCKK